MNPKDVTPSEISHTQKEKYCIIPLWKGTENRHIHRAESGQGGVAGGRKDGE